MQTRRILVLLTLVLAIVALAPAVQTPGTNHAPAVHGRRQDVHGRRRLLPGQLHAAARVPREAGPGVRPHQAWSRSARRPRAGRWSWRSSRRPRTTRSSRATRRSPASSRGPRASPTTRRASWQPKARPSSGSTAACTPPSAQRAAADRPSSYQMASQNDPETLRILNDVIILLAQVNPDGMELVSNWYMREPDEKQPLDGRSAAALPEVRGPRQQPRLLHDEPAGNRGGQPPAVHRVVPADHVQPSPDRPGRHGAVRAAVPRSVQLQLRPAGAAGHRPGVGRDPHPVRRRGQAGRDDADRRELLDVVQRRLAHDDRTSTT